MRYSSAIVALAGAVLVRADNYGPVSVSTDFITTEVTISKCGPGVTSCPYTTPTSSAGPKTPTVSVETDYITQTTTFCPLSSTTTPKPTPTPTLSIVTSVITHVTTKCPLSTGSSGPAPHNSTTSVFISHAPTSSAGALIPAGAGNAVGANLGFLGAGLMAAGALFL